MRFSFPFVGQKSTARVVRRTKELKRSGRARVRSCLRESVTLCVVDLASPVKILRCVYVLVQNPSFYHQCRKRGGPIGGEKRGGGGGDGGP